MTCSEKKLWRQEGLDVNSYTKSYIWFGFGKKLRIDFGLGSKWVWWRVEQHTSSHPIAQTGSRRQGWKKTNYSDVFFVFVLFLVFPNSDILHWWCSIFYLPWFWITGIIYYFPRLVVTFIDSEVSILFKIKPRSRFYCFDFGSTTFACWIFSKGGPPKLSIFEPQLKARVRVPRGSPPSPPTSGSRVPVTVNTVRTRSCRGRAGERCRRRCSQRPPQRVPWYSLWSRPDQRWRLAWRSWALACGWYRCWSRPWRTTDTTCTTRSRGRSTNRCSGASTTSWWSAAGPRAPWSLADYPRCVSHAGVVSFALWICETRLFFF